MQLIRFSRAFFSIGLPVFSIAYWKSRRIGFQRPLRLQVTQVIPFITIRHKHRTLRDMGCRRLSV